MLGKSHKDRVELTVSADMLTKSFAKHSVDWNGKFPCVKNPGALVDGLEKVCMKMCGGRIPEQVIIYVLEDDINPTQDVAQAKYFIRIDNVSLQKNRKKAYEIQIIYQPTTEVEAISAISGEEVIWTADNLDNSQHPYRTIYNQGFTYMICDNAPGFDIEPLPDQELSAMDLLELGVEGELPADIIEIKMPETGQAEPEEMDTEQTEEFEVSATSELFETEDGDSLSGAGSIELEKLSVEEFTEAEEEYNDIVIDFEELDELFE